MADDEVKQDEDWVDDELCTCHHFKSDHRAKYTGYMKKGEGCFEEGHGSCIMCNCSQFTSSSSSKRRRLDSAMAGTLIQLDATPAPKQVEWAKENPDLAISLLWWRHLNAQEMHRATIKAMKSPSATDEAIKSPSPSDKKAIKSRLFNRNMRVP